MKIPISTTSSARLHAVLFGLSVFATFGLNAPAQSIYQPYSFATLAGGTVGSNNGTGSAAQFNGPFGVAVDAAGNCYVADTTNHTIRRVTPAGVVTTLAGLAGSSGSADGTGATARFNQPGGVAVDAAGNIYVADTLNDTIRKVTSAGAVTTLAGLALNSGSANGSGAAARFDHPGAVTVDTDGNLFVADSYNHTIRKVTPGGSVTTWSGLAGTPGHADGVSEARYFYPEGVAVDAAGNVYVSDYNNHTIRRIAPDQTVVTLAGNPMNVGSQDGIGGAAHFYYPQGIAVDGLGNIYVGDTANLLIRKITPAGAVTTLGGLAGSVGSANGTGSVARFNATRGVAVDAAGTVYLADTGNNSIRVGVRYVRGDFGGDGHADILWRNTSTGDIAVWYMNGTSMLGAAVIGNQTLDWQIAGSGDFNSDGQTDILWRNTGTGEVAVSYMNGATIASTVSVRTAQLQWQITGTGDFNGDGQTDIVWRNTSTGDVAIWFMNGATMTSVTIVRTANLQWQIAGTGDFNGDGQTDLLWRNTSTGDVAIWFMNDATVTGTVVVRTAALQWQIAGTGDYYDDGGVEILWRNTSTGDLAIWFLDQGRFNGAASLRNANLQWQVAGTTDPTHQ